MALDTTNYEPAKLPSTNLQVDPSDTIVNTASQWTLNVDIDVPLMQECFIVLFFPTDLEYNFEFIEADGIFRPVRQSILSTSDFTVQTGFSSKIHSASDTRQSIKFFGCN